MPAPFSLFTRIPFWVQILAGLVLGVVLGLVARSGDVAWLSTTLTTVGELFIQLLKLAVPPLVFTAVVASIANLRGVTNAARLAGRTLMWFMATSLLAVVVGLGLGLLTNPGRGVTLDTGAAAAPKHVGTWTDRSARSWTATSCRSSSSARSWAPPPCSSGPRRSRSWR